MEISRIIIVPKPTKYELDMHKYRLSPDELVRKYDAEGVNKDDIISSHERQKKALSDMRDAFRESMFISADDLTRETAGRAGLVIALGGDNHFQYVSHFLADTPIIGVNYDPASSEGAVIYFSPCAEHLRDMLLSDTFSVEEWTRLQAEINGMPIMPATSEYFLGEEQRKDMSRYVTEFHGMAEKQKSSGVVVATGAGSSGWHNSASGHIHPAGKIFPTIDAVAEFIVTEPYKGRLTHYSMLQRTMGEDDVLVVKSLNDSRGIVTSDAIEVYPFEIGATAVVRVWPASLKVVKPGDA